MTQPNKVRVKQSSGQASINPLDYGFKGFPDVPYTICLDKLQINGFAFIDENYEEGEVVEISSKLTIVNMGKAQGDFQSTFTIYLNKQYFGKLFCHPRNKIKGVKRESTSVQIFLDNYILYWADWYSCYKQLVEELDFRFKNISMVDIAIDGLNYLEDFLNFYIKQSLTKKIINKVGRGSITPRVWDKNEMIFKNFQIGSKSTDRYMSLYLKTKEIEKSNKQYIKDFWKLNGICPKEGEDVFRLELRMKAKFFKKISGKDVEALTDKDYLFRIFKTGSKNLFEFKKIENDKTVTRQQELKILPHHFHHCELLQFAEKPIVDGTFAAKVAIHIAVKSIILGHYVGVAVTNALGYIHSTVINYRLGVWYKKNLETWFKVYIKLNPNFKASNQKYFKLEDGGSDK